MGINGLLPLLSPIHKQIHIKQFNGQAIGIDAYVWLHKGAFGCALELAQNIPTRKYIDYCLRRLSTLKQHGIWPIVCFDGGYLPMKLATESSRRSNRESNRQKGFECLKLGQKSKAIEYFQSCVDVTPRMAHELILELRKASIEYIVAPYEADAQLAYLERTGVISAIITEDSDLLVYGCQQVIYKMDAVGNGTLIRRKDFGKIKEFRNWTDTRFRQMCIMSGCDYLANPPNVGLKKAQAFLLYDDAHKVIKSWITWGKTVKSPKLPPGYAQDFINAEMTFLHQRVYDPKFGCLVTLNPLPDGIDGDFLDFIGPKIDADIARGIANGDIDPITKEKFSDAPSWSLCSFTPPEERYHHFHLQNHEPSLDLNVKALKNAQQENINIVAKNKTSKFTFNPKIMPNLLAAKQTPATFVRKMTTKVSQYFALKSKKINDNDTDKDVIIINDDETLVSSSSDNLKRKRENENNN